MYEYVVILKDGSEVFIWANSEDEAIRKAGEQGHYGPASAKLHPTQAFI